jgi:hypothetical protein
MDECGCNTNMKEDGQQGGKHYMVANLKRVVGHKMGSKKAK